MCENTYGTSNGNHRKDRDQKKKKTTTKNNKTKQNKNKPKTKQNNGIRNINQMINKISRTRKGKQKK